MSESKFLEVPCFGQSFQLGMLYDCRSHQRVPGPSLWKSAIIKNATVTRNSPQFKNQVFISDSLEEKMEILGIDSSLKLSVLTGLVSPSGIANVIFDQRSSKKQARVILKYESTSKFEELTSDQVKKELHRDISEEMTPTHYVSRIEYGREAVFIFDRDVDEEEIYADVENDLIKFTFDSLSGVPVDDSGAICTLEMDAEKMGKVKCTLYENKSSFKSSMTYEDAIKAYSGFRKNDGSSEREVPKKVWLHPLSSLDPNIVRPVHQVGSHVNDALQNIMANFSEFEIRLSDLFKSNVCSIFLDQKRQITRFEKALSECRKKILKTLSSSLLEVRRGDKEEKILTDVLEKVASSPFHQERLSFWISGKEKEKRLLSTYLEYFKDIQLVLSMEDLDSVVDSLEYHRVVCFTLMTVNNQDELVEQMYTFLKTGSWTQERPATQPWFENPEIIQDIESKASNFSAFARENEHDGSTKFIFTNFYKNTEKKVVSIQLYEDGHWTDFEPSGKPEKPFATKKTDSSVTLEWKESPQGKSSVQKYTVHFRPADSDFSEKPGREWKHLQTAGPERIITVDGLKAKRAYLFKVNSECKAGRSAFSDTSDSIVTEDFGRPPQTEGCFSASGPLQEKKEDSSAHSSSNEASNSTNNLTTPSTSANQVNRAENKNATGPTNPERKCINKERNGACREDNASNSKGTVSLVLYRPAESVLSTSKKIKSGPPSVYKLPTVVQMKRENSMIARKNIASPRRIMIVPTEKVLMVVGATGAGKTTLINGMMNYILGVKWKDDFRFKLIEEDSGLSQAVSQTKDITAYTLYPMNGSTIPYQFTIIDTPGFGDTEGPRRDKAITKQIEEFFSIPPPNGIDHLDGVGFVTQASLARLTPTQEYIFHSVLSIFGNDVSKNIFMMLTFADGQYPPVLEAIKKANIPCEKYFKFNNSALFAKTAENEESLDAMFWKMGFRSFQSFFAEFAKSECVSLRLTKEVLKEREQLQTLLEGLNLEITKGLNKIEEMRQEELILQHHEKEIETNKEFTYTVDISKPRQIDLKGTGKHTTTCLRCNFTCHKNCAYANNSDKRSCCAMGPDGNCIVCTMHCHWTEHRNLPYLIEYETVTETRTSDDLKKKYETAMSGKSKVEGMILQLEKFLQSVHSRVMTMICKAQQSLFRLNKIALKPNPLTEVQYLELLIESEKNEAKPGWSQRVEYFEEAKRQAEILSKVKDVNAAQKEIQEKVHKGEKWYRRFKFW